MSKKIRLSDLQREKNGFRCKRCGGVQLFVVYTRPTKDGGNRRVRECRECGTRIVTLEHPA